MPVDCLFNPKKCGCRQACQVSTYECHFLVMLVIVLFIVILHGPYVVTQSLQTFSSIQLKIMSKPLYAQVALILSYIVLALDMSSCRFSTVKRKRTVQIQFHAPVCWSLNVYVMTELVHIRMCSSCVRQVIRHIVLAFHNRQTHALAVVVLVSNTNTSFSLCIIVLDNYLHMLGRSCP